MQACRWRIKYMQKYLIFHCKEKKKRIDNILLMQSKKKIVVNLLWPAEGEILIKPPSLVRGLFQVTL